MTRCIDDRLVSPNSGVAVAPPARGPCIARGDHGRGAAEVAGPVKIEGASAGWCRAVAIFE